VNKLQPYSDPVIIEEIIPEKQPAFHQQTYRELSGMININVITTPLIHLPLDNRFNILFKRSFDVLFSLVLIVGVLSWLIPIIALMIWIDSKGPIFFLQKRNKKNGEFFTCIKFRSMIVNADADILPASEDDERITKFGRFLRDHYLDELPQFFNVLFGDMSIIGPRPHMISDNLKYESLIDHYNDRSKVKPGITGLAQVLGYTGVAGDLQKMKDRVNVDVFYLRHWSIKLDAMILLKTALKIFRSK